MRPTRLKWLWVIALAGLQLAAAQAPLLKQESSGVLLQRAIQKEVVDGDLQSAIEQYKAIIAHYPNDHAVIAQALIRMAGCYQKQGAAQARSIYEQVIAEYSDQKDAVAQAKAQLRNSATKGVPDTAPHIVCGLCGDESGFISANGRFLAVTEGNGITPGSVAIRDMGTKKVDVLVSRSTAGDGTNADAVLSPDLSQVAYSWSFATLTQLRVIANKAGSTPQTLVQDPAFLSITPAGWSPEGKSILATITRSDGDWLAWVSVSDHTTKWIKSLGKRLVGIQGRPALSPDGSYIAYSALAGNSSYQHIYLLAADGSKPESELIIGNNINESPVWTPDGSQILFISNRSSDTFDLRSIAVRDGKPDGVSLLLQKDIGRVSPNGISKDGVYFFTQKQTNLEKIVVAEMDAGGTRIKGATVQTTESLAGSLPSWSPDGKSIAVKQRRGPRVFFTVVHSLETGEQLTIDRPGISRNPSQWLHDSSGFLETISPSLSQTSAANDGTGALFRVDAKSGALKKLMDFGPSLFTNIMASFFQLSPDDRTLYMFGYEPGDSKTANRLISLDIDTGQQKLIFKLRESGIGLRLSPDGRTLAIVSDDSAGTYLSRIGIDGGNYKKLFALPRSESRLVMAIFTWSRDGRGILFEQEDLPLPLAAGDVHYPTDVTRQRIMYIRADGSASPQFTGLEVTSGRLQDISLNQDGSRIAYGLFGTGAPELWLIDLSSVIGKR